MSKRRTTSQATTSKNSKAPPALQVILAAIVAVILLIAGNCAGQQSSQTPTPTQPPTNTNTATSPATLTLTAPPINVTASASVATVDPAALVEQITFPLGWGAEHDFWQVYFTAPSGSRDPASYVGGIDLALVEAINNVQSTLDIAAYEFNNPAITEAVIAARQRGVRVRVVTDNEDGLEDDKTTLHQLQAAGIPIATDTRTALMHDKFMILDGTTVVTGSWNFTVNDTYRNNNNTLFLRSQDAVADYQAEFNEMFIEGRFGPTSPRNTLSPAFTLDGIPVQLFMGPEDDPMPGMVNAVSQAQHSVRFMAFSFTHADLRDTLLELAERGVSVEGIFETTGSTTQFAALPPLFCAGLDVRQDGNPFVMHHKVFIIDETTVALGSFNFSNNAADSNDENLIIISDPLLASQYLTEFNRRWQEAVIPTGIACN